MELVGLDDVKVDDTETVDNIVEGLATLTIGMYFETIEEARKYYERYGQENGEVKDDELEKFKVTLDSLTYEGKCECQQFEFVGILCAHILKVFVQLDIDEILKHFILPRWRQKADKFRIIDSQGLVHDDGKVESEALRLSHMCQEATKLACLAVPSNEMFLFTILILFNCQFYSIDLEEEAEGSDSDQEEGSNCSE
ncbi:hypothetical protein RHGRI_001965 [Rhododendron griersonianum]|uniref:Protein FAR1-RELATED SEQUENCE n=1 Tax=Rhododendron griersonianum TaxID=479676 RepID=A0AAV6LR08_9ERIC|nr:hypothetical protein RHGRI_001965 [Rhododendron griersonianum]